MSRFFSLVIAMTAGLAAVSTQAAENLTAETAGPGGAPYTTIISLGELASKAGIANFQVLDSQTLTNSLQNVAEGKSDVAAAPFILPFLLSKGAGPYAKLGKAKGAELAGNLAVLYTYRFGGMSLYAYDSSSVKGWGDLKGKRLINGPPRGAALANARAMTKIITGLTDGKDYKGVQANWGQMVKFITDGSGDAMVLPVYFPDIRITRGLASGSITLHSVPQKAWESAGMKKYLKSPGTGSFVLDLAKVKPQAGLTIKSEDGTWRSPATVGGDVVHKKMDFKLAKALTKTVITNISFVKAKGAFMEHVGIGELDPAVTGMCGPNPIKYHPGAVAAWEEAGHKVPDCAKP
jgi:TRAP-type uncharacterized transport system substrate-binding protein